MKRDGITQLVVLPLYPQFSVSTSGSSLRLLERLLKQDPMLTGVRGRIVAVAELGMRRRPSFASAMCLLVFQHLSHRVSLSPLSLLTLTAPTTDRTAGQACGDPVLVSAARVRAGHGRPHSG